MLYINHPMLKKLFFFKASAQVLDILLCYCRMPYGSKLTLNVDLSGFVGSLVLVGGDPGAGKSTMLLQVKFGILYFYSIVLIKNIFIQL